MGYYMGTRLINEASGDDAKMILCLVWPYLGTVKKEQAIRVGFTPPL